MAQKLTAGFLRNILSSQCRKLHSLRPVSFQLSMSASNSVVRSLPCPTIQRLRYSTDVALRDFLKEEIEAEKEVAKKQLGSNQSPTISGFQIKTDEADVTLTKTFNNEKITVYFNVNDCVRPHDDVETGTMDKTEMQEQEKEAQQDYQMYAEPSFRVEIEKNNQKLIFECDFVPEYASDETADRISDDDEASELFNISAVYMTTGEVTDKVYGASGEILDGTLYDHLFDYLAERGVDNKFGEEMIHFATHYEHAQYVNLLQKLKEFVSR